MILAAIMVPHPPLIIPEIGGGEEENIRSTIDAYEEAARWLCSYRPETIVVLSPHQVMYADYFHISPGNGAIGDFSQFRAEEVSMEVRYDTELVAEICRLAGQRELPAGTDGERNMKLDHGTMVPLYFVNHYLNDYRLVRVGLSGLSLENHFALGQCIREAAERLGRRVAVIASGDLSHRLKEDGPYGFREEGPAYDRRIMDVMGRADFEKLFRFEEDFLERAGECGHRAFTIMAGILDGMRVSARSLSYEGPFGVGYGVCTYEVQGDAYVQLARMTIESYICDGKKPDVPEGLLPEMYEKRAGVFVSLKKSGMLRGCIGTIRPYYASIAEEVIENAVSASTRDPRFFPVMPDEVSELTISVDVLGDTEEIDSMDELDVKRYGVVVTSGGRRGLLLPNLEGVDTVEQQVAIARQKAGIDEDESVQLERFEVVRHV